MDAEILKYHRTLQQLIQDIFKNNRKLKNVIMYGDMLDKVVEVEDKTPLTVIINLDEFVDKDYIYKYFKDRFDINAPLLVTKVNQTIINYKKQMFCINILGFNLIIKSLGKELKSELTFKTSY